MKAWFGLLVAVCLINSINEAKKLASVISLIRQQIKQPAFIINAAFWNKTQKLKVFISEVLLNIITVLWKLLLINNS